MLILPGSTGCIRMKFHSMGIPVTSAAGPKKAASGAEGRETKPTEWGERHSSEGKTNAFRRAARQKREEETVGRREKREERRG